MAKFSDPIKKLRELSKAESEPARERTFSRPLDDVSGGEAARATRRVSMVGNYAQRTFRLPPAYLDLIRSIAAAEHMSIADAERWVVNRGLLAYFEDNERPVFEQSVRRHVYLPDIDA